MSLTSKLVNISLVSSPSVRLNMRSRSLLPVRSLGTRSCHYATAKPSSIQAQLSGKAVTRSCRKPFSSGPPRFAQDSKTFTRYTLPKSIRIEKATEMTAKEAKRPRTAYIALGSNLGDRIAEIERACREMDARGIKVTKTSSLWETEPMYYADQDRFVNGVCEVRAHTRLPCRVNELTRTRLRRL